MRRPERIARILTGWRADAVLAAGLIVATLLLLAAQGPVHQRDVPLWMCCGLGVCLAIIPRRRHPVPAAAAAACLLALAGIGSASPNLPYGPLLVAVFLLAYSLGTSPNLGWSVAALVALGVGLQFADGIAVFNPFLIVLLIGSWPIGLVVRSRRRVAEQLAARGRELEAEREHFAAEAVRYERARIARELHDVVAHCISVMVIQASAGQRLVAKAPALAAEAFDAIAEVVRQAESDISLLVELLGQDVWRPGAEGIMLVDELVARASAAGLAVTCRFAGSADGLPAEASDAAYRVVQEGLTNALKHAPGASVEVLIAGLGGHVEICVVNRPASAPSSGLERSGGGNGLAGMRERVRACGGELTAGPVDGGGWQVLARLPLRPGQLQPVAHA